MNWKLIGLLCSGGICMGFATVLGLTKGIEGWLWLVLAAVCVWAIVRKARTSYFNHGFFTGLLGGGIAPVIQCLFFSTYLANNADLVAQLSQLPGGVTPRYFILAFAPVIGLVSGLTLGLACGLVAKLVGKKGSAAALR